MLDGWGIHMSLGGGWVWDLWGRANLTDFLNQAINTQHTAYPMTVSRQAIILP